MVDPRERLEQLLTLMERESEILQIEKKIRGRGAGLDAQHAGSRRGARRLGGD
jgi:hypothetical protein